MPSIDVMREAAIALAARGLPLFPLHYPIARDGRLWCSCGSRECTNEAKHPYSRLAPRGLLSASRDVTVIGHWWVGAAYNIGIPTGAVAGFVVLDVDPRHGGDQTLRDLELKHGPLPHTPRCLTGGGGVHVLFRHPGRALKNNAGKLGTGLDVRGDGGYIVAPPSQHISGREYAFDVDCHPDDVGLAEMPHWLAEMLVEKPKAKAAALPETWRKLVAEGVAEGRRNDALARLCGLLLRKDIDPFVARDLTLVWNQVRCKPPLTEAEAVAVIDSIVKRERARREGASDDNP